MQILYQPRDGRQGGWRLLSKLQESGVEVWNPESIFPGDNWAKETGKALKSSEVMDFAPVVQRVQAEIEFVVFQGDFR